ncbi:translation initiation factor eIF-2B subunit beta [Angomonas deanei]|nr:translation initiation factor eIF-2B subunit beta [Angomonas deanei]|eukprot:EPY33591.1 translation initiation factor eIF-2B subunit beta [Angomonas deanei]
MAGDAMLRSQFCVLLLMNVTRRILSILREAADRSRAQESDLEKEAKTILDDVGYDEEDTPVNSPHSSSTTELSPSPVTRKEGGLQRSGKRGFSVKFAERLDEHNYSAPTMQKELTPASPLMKRTSSAIAGQMVLKRAPSKRAHSDDDGNSFPVLASKFYEEAQGGIADFREEVEGMTNELCKRACRQLHSSDTIITMGCTNTTRRYLVEAAAARVAFRVIILEGAPSNPSAVENLAKELRAYNIDVQVLPDSSTFVVMSVSTKVLVAAESVLANGGMLAAVGTHMLCVAARHSAVPVLVATTTLKMSPYYPNDQLCTRLVRIARTGAQEMPWSTYGSTESILPLSHGVSVGDGGKGFVVHSPVTEYVPPELVTLYASNDTEFMPSQIHRFVRANYNDFD